jgi:hypothetical protein
VLGYDSTMLAFAIYTEELDWRPNLDVPVEPVELDASLLRFCQSWVCEWVS